MFLFLHRFVFLFARGLMLMAVPFVLLFYLPPAFDVPRDPMRWLTLGEFLGVAIGPVLVLRYLITPRCPNCRSRFTRDIIGSGNYECGECGTSSS